MGTDLGAQREDGSRESTPVILRYAAGAFGEAALPPFLTGMLSAVAFATPLDAWAIGQTGERQPLLLRSRDGGATWTDVSSRLPSSPYFDLTLTSIAFAGTSGMIAAQTLNGVGPLLSRTEDWGDSWSPFASHESAPQFSSALVRRNDDLVLLRSGWQRTVIEALGIAGGRHETSGSGGIDLEHGLIGAAVSVADSDTWVAGHRAAKLPGPAATEPAIVRIAGDAVAHESILCPLGGYLTAIDMASPSVGIAGGVGHGEDGDVPLLLHRDGAEARWTCGAVEGDLRGMAIRGVALGTRDDVWAVGHGHGVPGGLLLASFDGGRHWSRLSTAIDADGQLFAIAGSPEGQR